MKVVITLLIAISLTGVFANKSQADTTLVTDGKSTFTIVIPAKPPASVKAAAQEMQQDIDLATGAKLPIQKDTVNISGAIISLGATQQAEAAGVSAKDIAPSGFRILTKNGNLYIIGLDTVAKVNLTRKYYGDMTPQPEIPGPQYTENGGWSNGTANGVYTFLEEYLGVRWLMPGKLGLDVPSKSTFTLPEIDRVETPQFDYRVLSFMEKYTESIPAIHTWQNHQKLGFSFRLNHAHNWMKTVPASLFKTHPDWFAMVDGKRVPPEDAPGGRYKFETTNPELVRYYAEKAIASLKANPHQNTYSLSPSDWRGYSESPESKKYYDPSPSTVFDPESVPGAPSITPLMLKFYHDVSAIVEKEYPQGKLAGYLYQDYIYPPLQGSMKLPENFIPIVAPGIISGYKLYRQEPRKKLEYILNNWSKVIPTKWYFFALPNQLMERYANGIITPPGTGLLNHLFPLLTKSHMKGMFLYGNTSWSSSAMTNYIDAKLLWDPTLDANDLQHEWLMRAYGPQSGAVMEDFYGKLDGWFNDFYNKYKFFSYHGRELLYRDLYAPHYAEMEKLFLKAESQPMTSMQKARFDLLKNNLMVLRWRLVNAGYIPESAASPLKRNGAQIANLMFDGYEVRQTEDNAFDLFPVLWYRLQPRRTMVEVSLDAPPSNASAKVPNAGYILIYTTKSGEVSLKASEVTSGSAFAGYHIYEPRSKDKFRLMQQGLFYDGVDITFDAKANTLYAVRITPQGFVAPKLNYTLTVPNAEVTTGKFASGTLYLKDTPSSISVLVPKGLDVYADNIAAGARLRTMTPQDAARAAELKKHPGAKVLLNLDKGWKFQTDPQKTGLQQHFAAASYEDKSWKTVTATDSWQTQGFPNYHGTAWYRKSFKLPKHTGKVLLFFGAVDGDAVVYVNGQKAGQHMLADKGIGWDEPFAIDVTSQLKPGANTIAVQVTKNSHASGIFNGVALFQN